MYHHHHHHFRFDISTKEFVPTKTAKGAIVFPDAAALQRVLEMSALIGARASMQVWLSLLLHRAAVECLMPVPPPYTCSAAGGWPQ